MLTEVTIKNFRNHRDARFGPLADFFAFAGCNGSGKSNVLRALNLFFNGEVEPGIPLELSRDFHGSGSSKKKKEVRISCKLKLPSAFHFHRVVADAAGKLGLDVPEFWLSRVWRLDTGTGLLADHFEYSGPGGHSWTRIDSASRATIDLLLTRLLRFRYVPNHVHPLELIKRESERLQKILLTKIRRTKAPTQKVDLEGQLKAIAEVGESFVAPIVSDIANAAGLSGIAISSPTDWTQVALSLDLNLTALHDRPREASAHGSGHQSLLAITLLHLLDSQYSSTFGWHQGNIWALEEPESFLHHELCFQVGALLSRFAASPRFQILVTTHSPIMMAASEGGCLVNGTTPEVLEPRALIAKATDEGASPFVHPLLAGPPKPLLLVEGPSDKRYIIDAYKKSQQICPWDVRAVEELDFASGTSGFAELAKHHCRVLQGRHAASPVILLFDHGEKARQVQNAHEKLRQYHPLSGALQWKSSAANPDLDPDAFVGIEAFLSTRFLREAASCLGFELLAPAGKTAPLSVKKRAFEGLKARLAELAEQKAQSSDYGFLRKQLNVTENAGRLLHSQTSLL